VAEIIRKLETINRGEEVMCSVSAPVVLRVLVFPDCDVLDPDWDVLDPAPDRDPALPAELLGVALEGVSVAVAPGEDIAPPADPAEEDVKWDQSSREIVPVTSTR